MSKEDDVATDEEDAVSEEDVGEEKGEEKDKCEDGRCTRGLGEGNTIDPICSKF